MLPEPGERMQRFVGDRILFTVRDASKGSRRGWKAFLRTNLGRASRLRREIIEAHTRGLPPAGSSWRDLPMAPTPDGWQIEVPLAETGFFKAKAYVSDARGWQQWPFGSDVAISVHPDSCRSGNTIYCAFTRMFGPGKAVLKSPATDPAIAQLDQAGYAVLPPSGKLRDLKAALPHIVEVLGCRILHLLPIHPTPTTYARFGRFGSPYAALDLTAIDPALVEFDRRTTGVDQFCELTYATHLRGARVFLDTVINHTGWGSVLQENHPEWFLRDHTGTFVSPGAWGTTWEDLVELKHQHVALWDALAETFLAWCRRGVDGFRCDAGYKVPTVAWEYIIARVREEYPDAVFLLEGLGGAWETTEALLLEGGMQWAYSELFQNYSPQEVSSYLDHTFRQAGRSGLLVHYSETHDNERLAAKGRGWSLLRNRLCALASTSGGFGFTCGVEWLASERIKVHESRGMAWGAADNIVPELGRLNALLLEHPCFYDGATITRISPPDSTVLALTRLSAETVDKVLVLVNTDAARKAAIEFDAVEFPAFDTWTDLLGQSRPAIVSKPHSKWRIQLPAGGAYCLSPSPTPVGLHGEAYRLARARAAWGLQAICRTLPVQHIGPLPWPLLAEAVDRSPAGFLASVRQAALVAVRAESDEKHFALEQGLFRELLAQAEDARCYASVVRWSLRDGRRVMPVPPGHWLLIEDDVGFRARLTIPGESSPANVSSVTSGKGHVACFPPRTVRAEAWLTLERYDERSPQAEGRILFLGGEPAERATVFSQAELAPDSVVLLTNDRGAMSRLCVDFGRVNSKYDCVLGANLHPSVPVDRHVFAKRMRLWVNAEGFLSPLDFRSLKEFTSGPETTWSFVANAGDGRTVQIGVSARMLPLQNTVVFRFTRPTAEQATGVQLPPQANVRLTVRIDIEDRSFHCETKRNGGAEHHFRSHTSTLSGDDVAGFVFAPAPDRQLRVTTSGGQYHPQPEWSENIPHPVEQSRGMTGSGDAYSPGWFEVPMPKGADVSLVVSAELQECAATDPGAELCAPADDGSFSARLVRAARQFLVRRGEGETVVAGYPWFLDWGRDTFICARGFIAAGFVSEVRRILLTFAAFEHLGTLPNIIHGEDASNRDTSDAPLWFGLACEELVEAGVRDLYAERVGKGERTLGEVLQSIAAHYVRGTPNGIRVDPESGLVWSPGHFTWMDTNYPACTPRQGYPVELQALWVRLLEQLAGLPGGEREPDYASLAGRARKHFDQLFWRETEGHFSDCLFAQPGQSATKATPDDALRSNCLLAISLGLAVGERARRCVESARRWLVIPGALRSLAPLPVKVPLALVGNHGQSLNDPHHPYWGRYEGDEDTRRKPAYHNGTAWTWTFPVFCEALARAWDSAPEAVAAARAYLASMRELMDHGCLGHLPEVLDGDAPHCQRGCDAQAWAATEALRVLKLLQ